MRKAWLGLIATMVGALGFVANACTIAPDVRDPASLTPEEAAQARRTIQSWLECRDCTDEELERVVALGQLVVPSLQAALERGPSPARLVDTEAQLRKLYTKTNRYAAAHNGPGLSMSEDEYVERYLDLQFRTYRQRSIAVLGRIRGPEARAALESAAALDVDDSTRRVLDAALSGFDE